MLNVSLGKVALNSDRETHDALYIISLKHVVSLTRRSRADLGKRRKDAAFRRYRLRTAVIAGRWKEGISGKSALF